MKVFRQNAIGFLRVSKMLNQGYDKVEETMTGYVFRKSGKDILMKCPRCGEEKPVCSTYDVNTFDHLHEVCGKN